MKKQTIFSLALTRTIFANCRLPESAQEKVAVQALYAAAGSVAHSKGR